MDDLDSLINNLNEALTWLGAMGIHPHTRFSEYQNKLVTVQNHRISGKLTELLHTVPLEHYRIAFIESSHLIAIAKTFKRVRGPRFKEKVRIAVSGPAHPLNEKTSGWKARDFLFELSVAAFFRSRRLPVLTCSQADLITRSSGSTILIECKRPQSGNKVERSIKEAAKQLIEHFKNYPRGIARYGFIAMDISIVTNPQRMFVMADSIDVINREVDTLFDPLLTKFASALAYRHDKRILGILAFAKVLAYCAPENRYVSFQKIQPYIHGRRGGTYESILAEEICNRFSPGSFQKTF